MIASALALAAVASAAALPIHVPLRETLVVQRPGATAAYAIDSAVAEASAFQGAVTLHARGAGSTLIAVVTGSAVDTFEVVVDAPPPHSFFTSATAARNSTTWEGYYDTGTERLSNSLDVLSTEADGRTRLTLLNMTRLGERQGDALSSFPWASLEVARSGRRLVLLDELVEHSPLTLDGTALRGLHYSDGALELHGGATSPLLFQDFLVPSTRELAAGASYRIRAGRSAFTPNVYAFDGDPRYGGKRGMMGSLLYDFGERGDPLRIRAEAGYGGKPGGALHLDYQTRDQRLWLDARYQPAGFAGIGLGRPHGSFADAAWNVRLAPAFVLDLTGSFARQELPRFTQRTESGSAQLRYTLADRWFATGGATASRFQATGLGANTRSLTLPVGLLYEGEHAGLAALYRYQRNSASSRGGSGGRLSVRGSWSHLQASAFADYQRDAATLDLVFREQPGLERAFVDLGLSARTPEDLARILRDTPALADLGFIEGITVNLHPWRMLAGADVGWSSEDETRQRLRLHMVLDRTHGVVRAQQIATATLSYSRRLAGSLEGLGNFTLWTADGPQVQTAHGWALGIGLRILFGDVPHLPSLFRSGSVSGLVSVDGTTGRGFAGVRVRLDGQREVLTDPSGHFEFDAAGAGMHRVDVIVPPDSYFTTSSSAFVQAGTDSTFSIALAPAHVSGEVRDDAGTPLAGIAIHLMQSGRDREAITDSSGRYALVVAEGEATLSVDTGTVPAGYDTSDVPPRGIAPTAATPVSSDYVIAANRSIAGTVRTPTWQRASVWLVGHEDAKAMVEGDGRFLFRKVKPGTWIIAADIDGKEFRKTVQVPAGPAVIGGIDFDEK
jgi:hypothetical protein